MNYWYVARRNELLIDCDSKTLLELFFKRLEKVNPSLPYPLDVESIFVSESSENHFHIAIKIKKNLPGTDRVAWQLYLMDDVYRSTMNLFRVISCKPAPILLISPHNWLESGMARYEEKFWRNPDAVCQCQKVIHKSPSAILKCPAHIKLRGSK